MKVRGETFRLAGLLSGRRIRERPLRSALTMAGVAAGVALLLSVLLLNAQMSDAVHTTGAMVTGPRLLQVSAASPGGLPETLAAQLADDPRVEVAASVLVSRTTVSTATGQAGVFVLGANAELTSAAHDSLQRLTVESTNPHGVGLVVSNVLARRLSLKVGQEIAVTTPAGARDLRVAAIVSSPLLNRVNSGMAAFTPLADAQHLFGRPGRVDQILVAAKAGTAMTALRSDLGQRLAGAAMVGHPGAATGAASSDLTSYSLGATAAGLMALVVAAVLVFNTMTMAFTEQRAEVALARSLGATRRQLLGAAIAEAGTVGAAGTLIGLLSGGLLARAVIPFARALYEPVSPVDTPTALQFRPGPFVIAAAAGMVVAVAGAVLPARRAARAAPVDALRPAATYEWRDPAQPTRALTIALAGALLCLLGAALAFRAAAAQTILVAFAAMFAGLALLLPSGVPLASAALAAGLGRLSPTTGRLSGDALRTNPRRTTITVVGLALPLAMIVASTGAFNAATAKFERVARSWITAPLNVDADSFLGYVAAQSLAPTNEEELAAVPGVRAVLPYQDAFVALPDASQGVLFAIPLNAAQRAGVPDLVKADQLSNKPDAFRQGLGAGQIAASELAARSLHLHPGSRLTLPTPNGPHAFTVAALYEDWSMRGTFYIDHDTYTQLWGDHNAARYGIVPTPGTSLDSLRDRLNATISSARMAAHVHTSDEAVRELIHSGLGNLISLAHGMELTALLCAAAALANTAFTAIAERRWTLGLQRALGMTRRQLTRSLALEALAIGLIGSAAGALMGLGLGSVLTQAMATLSNTHLPHPIPWTALVANIALGVGVSTLASQYPRRNARRQSIIDSLRYE
jgi:putative ABC transport system permease protein